jgi:FKBP-type peptidyl-prolyl cis-trans isomerase
MKRLFLLGAFTAVLCACNSSPYEGYKRVAGEVDLRLHILGDGEQRVEDGDSIHLRLRAALLGQEPGSYVSTEQWFAARDLRQGAFVPVLQRMHEGDSMSVIARGTALPWSVIAPHALDPIADTAHVQVELSMLGLRTAAMMQAEQERIRTADPEAFERELIAAYRARTPGPWLRWGTSEVYYVVSGTAVDTTAVRMGEQVTIAYTGARMEDGHVFDDTGRNGGPLSFRFGDPDQVMPGLETAVHLLREGQEGTFLLPSPMAFGAKGIPGVLDPYTPVVYTVHLEKVGGIVPLEQ